MMQSVLLFILGEKVSEIALLFVVIIVSAAAVQKVDGDIQKMKQFIHGTKEPLFVVVGLRLNGLAFSVEYPP